MLVGSSYLRGDHLSGRGVPLVARSWRLAFKNLIAIKQFESVLTRGANENSVLTPEASKKRESESSEPLFRTVGRNLKGCVRETEISLQTEIAAVWAVGTRKAFETREKLGRNEKRPAVDLSTPGVKSFGRQSSYFDASSSGRTRTYDPAVNSRLLYQLSYRGSAKTEPRRREGNPE